MNEAVVGRPGDNPLRNCDEIRGDICRMVCISSNPCGDLVSIMKTCKTLYDQHKTVEILDVEKIVSNGV